MGSANLDLRSIYARTDAAWSVRQPNHGAG
jgi:hypothetical protein